MPWAEPGVSKKLPRRGPWIAHVDHSQAAEAIRNVGEVTGDGDAIRIIRDINKTNLDGLFGNGDVDHSKSARMIPDVGVAVRDSDAFTPAGPEFEASCLDGSRRMLTSITRRLRRFGTNSKSST